MQFYAAFLFQAFFTNAALVLSSLNVVTKRISLYSQFMPLSPCFFLSPLNERSIRRDNDQRVHIMKDIFLNKQETLDIAMRLLSIWLPYRINNDTEKLLKYYAESHVQENIDAIFSYSESPIEKIFLNALHVCSLLTAPFLFMFSPPLSSANDQVHNYRSFYSQSKQMWEDFQEKSSEKSIEAFLISVQSRTDLTQEVKSMLESFAMLELFDRHNSYILSLQATFEGFIIQGKTMRPDIFIWIPSKPEFGLVVECDGFAYHSDKLAFSNDRARDRLIQYVGFQVFRFSGSEIVNDPIGKARELYDFLVTEKYFKLEGKSLS